MASELGELLLRELLVDQYFHSILLGIDIGIATGVA
jgi:hypothetical protein